MLISEKLAIMLSILRNTGFIHGKILLTSDNSYFRLLLRIIVLIVIFTFQSY